MHLICSNIWAPPAKLSCARENDETTRQIAVTRKKADCVVVKFKFTKLFPMRSSKSNKLLGLPYNFFSWCISLLSKRINRSLIRRLNGLVFLCRTNKMQIQKEKKTSGKNWWTFWFTSSLAEIVRPAILKAKSVKIITAQCVESKTSTRWNIAQQLTGITLQDE